MGHLKKAILIASATLCFNLSAFSQGITLKNSNVTVKELSLIHIWKLTVKRVA